MEDIGSRSYLVRVRSRDGDRGAVGRVVVEEVRSGRQVELRGQPASELADRLEAALATAGPDVTTSRVP